MGDFFVARGARRHGCGSAVVEALFERYRGPLGDRISGAQSEVRRPSGAAWSRLPSARRGERSAGPCPTSPPHPARSLHPVYAARMTSLPASLGAVTLFVDDAQRSKVFYERAFELPVLFEDDNSAAFRFENTIVNLLSRPAAPERRACPGRRPRRRVAVSADDAGSTTPTRPARSSPREASSCSTGQSTGRGVSGRQPSLTRTATSGKWRRESPSSSSACDRRL